jgi:pyruvate carboxylase
MRERARVFPRSLVEVRIAVEAVSFPDNLIMKIVRRKSARGIDVIRRYYCERIDGNVEKHVRSLNNTRNA